MLQDRQVDGEVVHDGVGRQLALLERIAGLEVTVAQLRVALVSRQQLGVATGLTAALLGASPDEAWTFLVKLSQNANVKVRDVGRVIVEAHGGQLSPSDHAVAERLRPHLPPACGLLTVPGDVGHV